MSREFTLPLTVNPVAAWMGGPTTWTSRALLAGADAFSKVVAVRVVVALNVAFGVHEPHR